MKQKEHHNPFFICPFCNKDDVYLIPPCFGDPGIYVCNKCNKQISPVSKEKKK
jgi:ribosomal protein L37AE/L43A